MNKIDLCCNYAIYLIGNTVYQDFPTPCAESDSYEWRTNTLDLDQEPSFFRIIYDDAKFHPKMLR